MKIIIAYKNDALVQWIANGLKKDDYVWITPIDVVNKLKVYHCIDSYGKVSSEWMLPQLKLRFEDITWCMNRIQGLGRDLFFDFIEEDQYYAYNEFNAYLVFALKVIPNILNEPVPGGLCGETPSHLEQFHVMRQDGWLTPEAITTTIHGNAIQFCEKHHWNIVFKDHPYFPRKCRVLDKDEKRRIIENKEDIYYLTEKIQGRPFFTIVVGDKVFTSSGYDLNTLKQTKLDQRECQKILNIGKRFGLRFYEVKTVEKDNKHYFEYLSPSPSFEFCKPWKNEIRNFLLQI